MGSTRLIQRYTQAEENLMDYINGLQRLVAIGKAYCDAVANPDASVKAALAVGERRLDEAAERLLRTQIQRAYFTNKESHQAQARDEATKAAKRDAHVSMVQSSKEGRTRSSVFARREGDIAANKTVPNDYKLN